MSKEDKIHEWIEAQNSERKQQHVESLKREWGLENLPTPPVRKRLSIRKITSICAASFVCVMAVLFSTLYFTVWQDSPNKPKNKSRYCTSDQYTYQDSSLTLKDYAIQTNQNILYFDIYENVIPETTLNRIYLLNDTQEDIAFREYMMAFLDSSVYTITYYVTDNYTELEELEDYKLKCVNTTSIKDTTISWVCNSDILMKWEYEGYRYYLTLKGATDESVAFELVENMLNQ